MLLYIYIFNEGENKDESHVVFNFYNIVELGCQVKCPN